MCYFVSKVQGPPAYPIIGNIPLLTGSHEEITRNLVCNTNKYSPVGRLWFGPIPVILTNDPRLLQEILTNHLEKADIMKFALESGLGKSLLTSEVPKWKQNRSVVIRGFSPVVIKSYFKIFNEKIHILSEKLDMELNNGKSFDISEYFARFTLDAVCGSTMGVNISAQDCNSSYFDAMQSVLNLVIHRGFSPLLYSEMIYRMTPSYQQFKKCKTIVRGLTKQIILEKKNEYTANNNIKFTNVTELKKNEYNKPLLEYLLDFTRNNPNFTDEDLELDTNFTILAGFETTAKALSFVILNLAANKNIQNKVFEEILSVLNDSNQDKVSFDDLSKLTYMEMVIKESMRLHSTVPFIGRKAAQDIHFDNYIIPKGIDVFIFIFCLHRNETYWENPLKFDPERFTTENIKSRHPYAYIPFSGGPRNCLGMRYAMSFMKLTLATLLSRYEFHTDLNLDELRYEFEISLKLIDEHQVRITPRPNHSKSF